MFFEKQMLACVFWSTEQKENSRGRDVRWKGPGKLVVVVLPAELAHLLTQSARALSTGCVSQLMEAIKVLGNP